MNQHPPGKQTAFKLHPGHGFVLPYVLLLLTFGIGPGVYALLLSFSGFEEGRPVLFQAGLKNYSIALSDFRFIPAFSNVLHYLLVSLPFGVIGVVLISLVLHARQNWLSSFARVLYFVPGAVAGPAVVLLSYFMFDPNVSPFGPLIRAFGFKSAGEVVFETHLPLLFTLIGFFAGAGGWVAIFYGALNSISREVLEAAVMDGCNTRQVALSIKLPIILPYIVYMIILTFAGNVQLFVEPALLSATPGSTVSKYWSPNQLSYAFAFELGNFGAAAVISLVMLIIGLVGATLVLKGTSIYRTDAATS